MYPLVSVVVVVYNEEKYIQGCIESLLRLNYPKNRYEVVVVDGMSTDRTQEIVKKYPIKLVINKARFCPPGRNLGVENARGDYVAFTDGDCEVDVNWLKTLVDEIRKCPDEVVSVGGPNLVFETDSLLARTIGHMQETYLGSGGSAQSYKIDEPRYVESIPTCNILYKKEILAKERYDDELKIGEDAELHFRLRRLGYKFLYLPNAIVWHHRRSKIVNFIGHIWTYGKAMGGVTRKHKKIIRFYAFLPPLAIIALILAYPLILYFPLIIWIYLLGIGIYSIALLISSLQVYNRIGITGFILTMLLLPLQHFIYGVGFLMGALL
ncbi:MAG: glycosyltransferase [Candidatus Altiarchaeota archaeon]|nr:glycosyltransferase [Candidatus Altiarchaeota archaeon]